jgi:hypothetical protein
LAARLRISRAIDRRKSFPPCSTERQLAAQVVHRVVAFRTCGKAANECKVREYNP